MSDCTKIQASAFIIEVAGHAIDKAQGIEHEFKRQSVFLHALALDGRAVLYACQIVFGVAHAHGALDFVVVGNLAMRPRTDADVVAKLPIIDVVAARQAIAIEGRGFVTTETSL